jgi:hypothetical protein
MKTMLKPKYDVIVEINQADGIAIVELCSKFVPNDFFDELVKDNNLNVKKDGGTDSTFRISRLDFYVLWEVLEQLQEFLVKKSTPDMKILYKFLSPATIQSDSIDGLKDAYCLYFNTTEK